MLSATGKCHSFDASADGYARGEGCGMLLLKKVNKNPILHQYRNVLATITATNVNHDGTKQWYDSTKS